MRACVCACAHRRVCVRAFSGQMKNQYIFRVIHIQCPQCFRPDGEREREGAGEGGMRGGEVAGWGWVREVGEGRGGAGGRGGGNRLFVCHNCTIAFSEPLVNISELM